MRPPARLLVLFAWLVALAGLVACGDEGDSGGALDSSLGYLPKDAPFAAPSTRTPTATSTRP